MAYTADPTNFNQPDPQTVPAVALAVELKALKYHIRMNYATQVQLASAVFPNGIPACTENNNGLSLTSDGTSADYRISAADALSVLRVFGVTP